MNVNTRNISVETVEQFRIQENFQQGFPCSHNCKVTLTDGRNVKKKLCGPDIYILIQAIANEKITFKRTKEEEELSFNPQTLDKFNTYADIPYSAFKIYGPKEPPLPSELLASLFKEENS